MKGLIATILLIPTMGLTKAEASPHFVRQWSRSSLLQQNRGFRHLNLMSPWLTDSLVLTANSVNGVKAFRRDSGAEVWSFFVSNGVEGLSVDGERVFFGGGDGNFYCLDLFSGKEIWKVDIHSESLTRPTIDAGRVYHVAGNNTLHVFDKETGETLWAKTHSAKSTMTVRGQTAPLVDTGIIFVGYSDGNMSALNSQNGRELWSKRIGDDKKFNDVDSTPVIAGSCLLVSSFANALYCMDRSNGQIKWRHDFGGFHSVYVRGDKIYYPTLNSEIHILDLNSGKLLKKIVKIKGLPSQVSGLRSMIVYGESNGGLIVRDQESLQILFSFQPGRGVFTGPSVDEKRGEIYFASREGNIYRFDLSQRPSNPLTWSQQW
jgi:outer membrane protein assembly factor BamB